MGGALAPRAILRIVFGSIAPDAVTITIVRHWSLLVGLVGCLLVYAAYDPDIRVPAMLLGLVEKFALGWFVLSSPLRARRAAVAVAAADTVMAILYLVLLAQGVVRA